jgi:hypothetical protein
VSEGARAASLGAGRGGRGGQRRWKMAVVRPCSVDAVGGWG